MSDTQVTSATVDDKTKTDIVTEAAQPYLGVFRDTARLPAGALHDVLSQGAMHAVERLAQRLGVSIENFVTEGRSVTETVDTMITKIFDRAGLIQADGSVITAGAMNDLRSAATPLAGAHDHSITDTPINHDISQERSISHDLPVADVIQPQPVTSELDEAHADVPAAPTINA